MVNRTFIILTLLWAFILTANSQNTFKKELSVGGSFGMGVSSVSFTPRVQTNQLLGVHLGFTGRWITEKNLGLILELNFAQEGWDEKFDMQTNEAGELVDHQYTRRINYIDIPFLTHIYFGGKRLRFFINLGPKIGYAISENTTENVGDLMPPPNNSEANTAQRYIKVQHKFAWGICGGPGIELRTGIGNFLLEGRYYYGLGDIFNSRKGDAFSKSSSQVILGKLTYLLPL